MNKRLILISPGPKMSIDNAIYEGLSKEFSGDVITSSMEDNVIATKSVANFKFNCIKYYHNKLLSYFSFLGFCLIFAIKARLLRNKYDLVVTYDPIKSGIAGVLISRILNIKFAPEVNGVYTSPAEYIDGNTGVITKLKKLVVPLVIRFVLKRADGIKLLFDSQIDPFQNVLNNKVIARFPCYVAIDKFENLKEENEILFVGFPFKRKGVDILIAAFKKIASRYPDWKLKILGWFPDHLELDSAIDKHPQIYHHKPVYYNEMPKHIGSCAVVVLPSRSEAMGRVLVEAMAAGKPRIGSNVDGIPTVINDGVDGLLVEPQNVDDLAEKLEMLICNSELRKTLGENGKRRALNEFSSETYYKNLFNFYNKLIS